jgi:hypothetical protein
MSKNKLKTPSYFIKRLRDNGFIAIKLFTMYDKADPRRWTAIVNPGERSVLITCYNNKDSLGDVMFEFNDGGVSMPKNIFLNTSSIEVIIDYLITKGVSNTHYQGRSRFVSKDINNNDEGQEQSQKASGSRE